ncbi:MAG: TRAP transporter substrate-binding protein DctP [Candidatus Anammoxibacter sp.]
MIKRTTKKILFCLMLCGLYISLFTGSLSYSYAEVLKVIRLATLAPEGSTWTKVLHDIDEELQSKSNGGLKLKIYAGGVAGDENSYIMKMHISKIHCAAFTNLGLSEILPEARILDLPSFYKNHDEFDLIKNSLNDMFGNSLKEKGYVLLGWSELGCIYFFSKEEIKSISDLRSTKMWLWQGDKMAGSFFEHLALSSVPLPLVHVTSSLQTGLVNAVYGPPIGVIALNWFKDVKYMLDLPIANAAGAILITKKYYKSLSPDHQGILKSTFRKHLVRLTQLTRKNNEKSIEAMHEYGIKLTTANDNIIKEFDRCGKKTCEELSGRLFPDALLKVVTAKIEKHRKSILGKGGKESNIVRAAKHNTGT